MTGTTKRQLIEGIKKMLDKADRCHGYQITSDWVSRDLTKVLEGKGNEI